MGLLVRIAINALALWVAGFLVNLLIPGGMRLINTFPAVLWVALIFGVVNALVKPVISLLSCPITLLTLGLFTLVINALCLMLTSWLAGLFGGNEWLSFSGFWAALLAGIFVSITSTVLSMLATDSH
jgi:putative membrane protein